MANEENKVADEEINETPAAETPTTEITEPKEAPASKAPASKSAEPKTIEATDRQNPSAIQSPSPSNQIIWRLSPG